MIHTQLGSESLTVADTAIGFASIPTTGRLYYALCRVETATIRINSKDTPTALGTEGSPEKIVSEEFEVWGEPDIRGFKAIRTTATSGVLRILYFGEPA